MNPLRCCVIDDEPLAGKLIASYVERTPGLELSGLYTSASDAVKDILGGGVDVAFLDIEMPQINGMEFAKIIPPTCRIIFTTAYDQYAVQGYKVNAVDYLLKPISYAEFLEAVGRLPARAEASPAAAQQPKREFIIVKSEYRQVQVRIADIECVEGLKDYIKIYITGQPKPLLTLMSMKAIEHVLGDDRFMRVHRSYIVNKERIAAIERNTVIIAGRAIPISETYRPAFTAYIASLNPEE